MAENRLAVVEGAFGQLMLVRTVSPNFPKVVTAGAIAEKYDVLAVRRPLRLARVIEDIRDPPGFATAHRQHIDAALQIHRQHLAVWGNGDRHRGPLMHGDGHVLWRADRLGERSSRKDAKSGDNRQNETAAHTDPPGFFFS